MTRPRLLDLFAGAGGCARGYTEAGFDVVGVDIKPQPRYLLSGAVAFHQADALEFLAEHGHEFACIHASPPCQAYSSKTPEPAKHPDLIAPTRAALIATDRPYVIENVEGAPLIDPFRLCGSSFGLRVRRHRLFESNVFMLAPRCHHAWQDRDKRFTLYDHGRWFDSGIVHVFGTGGGKGAEHWADAMGIAWMTRDELAEAIPPAYSFWIGTQLLAYLDAVAA